MRPSLPFHGHREAVEKILARLDAGTLPHALLLTGPAGIGKRCIAEFLAQALLCASDAPPCGACPSCKLAAEGKHPDLALLQADNGRIKIDMVRDLIRDFSFAPLMGTRRVVLVPEAHAFNAAAANSLLKTLEEPPAGTFFLLVTHAPGWIPRTILSRCQKLRFGPLSDEDLSEVLREKGVEPDAALTRWSLGSAERALSLSEVRKEIPALDDLMAVNRPFAFSQAYQTAQAVAEEEKIEVFLTALLSEAHRRLVAPEKNDNRFDLLCFTDKILEIRRRLRLNLNAKMALSRLLMFFQEPLESRLNL